MKDIIGRYRIRQELGKGALATVYAAEDLALGRTVALKLFSAEALKDPANLKQFMSEARILSSIKHPNIVNLYEIGKSASSFYIVTELIEGENLRDCITQEPIPLEQTLDIAIQVAGALDAAHDAGLVHSDLKPENIIVKPDTSVKVIDFGVATFKGRHWRITINKVALQENLSIDKPGIAASEVKDVPYLSPEEVLGLKVNRATDIWRLGVVLSEMVSQRTPFKKKTAEKTIASILHDKPGKLTRDTPRDLARIVTKALQKAESERYRSAKEMASDLIGLRRRIESGGSGDAPIKSMFFLNDWYRTHTPISSGLELSVDDLSVDDDAPDVLYINLWIENEKREILSTPAVLTKDMDYMFMFAIDKWSLEGGGYSEPFEEPPELRDEPVTKVIIELICPFLTNGGDTGYVRREVNYHAGIGFPPEKFALKPNQSGRFYLTARLLIKGETIYREVLALEVLKGEPALDVNRSGSLAAHT